MRTFFRKMKIRFKLWSPNYKGRSLSTLRKACGLTSDETKDLLNKMGVRSYQTTSGKTRYRF